MAEVVHEGAHQVRPGVRGYGVLRQRFIQTAERTVYGILMAKHLHDLLPLDHLLNIAVYLGKRILARFEIAAAALCNGLCNEEHNHEHADGNEREDGAEQDHHHKRADDADDRADELWNALAEHLAHGVDVVGVGGHDLAVCAGIKITDRKLLHVREKLAAQLKKRAGRDRNHQAVVKICAADADRVHHEHDGKLPDEPGKVRLRTADPRHDIIVDDGLQHVSARNVCTCAQRNADKHQHKLEAVSTEIGKRPCEGALHVLRPAKCVFPLTYRRHIRPPPSAEIRILHDRFRCVPSAPHACRRPKSGLRPSPRCGLHPLRR